jgi:peptide/nickel transport system substrate-binding protein
MTRPQRKSALAILAALAVVLVVAGCGGGGESGTGASAESPAKPGGTMRIAPETEATTLLPAKAVALPEIQILTQVMQGLLISNAEGKIEPLLAEKYEHSPDLREWTFHLHPGVQFTNGEPLTSADVLFSLEEAEEGEVYGNLYEGIEEVSAPNQLTVIVKTKDPAPALPSILALYTSVVVPKDYGGQTAQQFATAPVGTGPFELASWKRGRTMTLKRNPHYWQKGLPLLDEVVYVTAPSDVSRVQQLKAGEVDAIAEPPFAQLEGLESLPGFRASKGENSKEGLVLINARKPLFADRRAREAVSLALNRDDMTVAGYKGYGQVAAPYFPLSMLYADKSLKPVKQNVAKAKQLLAEAVAATGEEPDFTLYVETGNEVFAATTQVMQQNLEEIGMKTSIQQLDSASFIEELSGGHYDLSFMTGYSNLHDPVEQVSWYPATEGFWTGATDVDQIKKLEQEALVAIEPKEREALYHQIQQQIYEEDNVVVVNNSPTVYMTKDSVSGFEVSPTATYNLTEVGFSE